MSIFKMIFAFVLIAVGILILSGRSRAGLDLGTMANAAQPTPVVSVTTLPAMPGTPTTGPLPQQPGPAAPQMAPQDAAGHAIIEVGGDVANPLSLTLKDLERMRRSSLTLRIVDPDGKSRVHTFTGALLSEVIEQARPRFAHDPATLMRKYVYVTGIDGASAIVGFPEFEPAFNGKVIILAYLIDFNNLSSPGFAELVVQEDATRARFLTVARLTVGEPAR